MQHSWTTQSLWYPIKHHVMLYHLKFSVCIWFDCHKIKNAFVEVITLRSRVPFGPNASNMNASKSRLWNVLSYPVFFHWDTSITVLSHKTRHSVDLCQHTRQTVTHHWCRMSGDPPGSDPHESCLEKAWLVRVDEVMLNWCTQQNKWTIETDD